MKIRYRSLLHAAPALAAAAVGFGVALPALAQTPPVPDCANLGGDGGTGHVVYVGGSSAVKPFLAKLAAKLLTENPPIYLVYPNNTGSCDGVNYMTQTDATITGLGAVYWDGSGSAVPGGCNLEVGGTTVDIGASDVFPDTCGLPDPLQADVKDFTGPIQTMTFSVPTSSTATSISAEAAYMVYGFDAAAGKQVTPWTDPTLLFQRDPNSGTETMIATAIKVPAAKWLGGTNTNKTSDDIFGKITGSGDASKIIGILSAAYADLHRDKVKELPFQAYGQSCGYLPDSSPTAFDKANVRDGHYDIWGPLHLLVHTGSDGKATNPDAQRVIDALTMAVDPGFDLIQVEAKNGVIPQCAMHVSRDKEVGAMTSVQPTGDCTCKFVTEATGTAPTECKTCSTNANCTSDATRPVCSHGYCEAK
jgi:ABC-type phosphate transport system substrate-binding protein